MKVIGFRVSTDLITYSILDGTKNAPIVKSIDSIKFPKGYKRNDLLRWMYAEMASFFKREAPELIALKDVEVPARKGNSYTERLENETTVVLAGLNNGVKNYYKKIKSTIAKDLTGKGKGKYLVTFDTTPIKDFATMNVSQQESILVAWSLLK